MAEEVKKGRKPVVKKEEISNIIKFTTRVQNLKDGGYFEIGKEYQINEQARIDLIINQGWGKLIKEEVKE